MVQVLFVCILQTDCMILAVYPSGLLSRCLFKAIQINVPGTQGEEAWVPNLAQVECLLSFLLAL